MISFLIKITTLALISISSFAHEIADIKLYDGRFIPASKVYTRKGKLSLVNGKRTFLGLRSKKITQLNKNLEFIRDIFAEKFNQISWDNRGSDIEATINISRYGIFESEGLKSNAFWFPYFGNNNQGYKDARLIFGAGNPKKLKDFEFALDVVAHEFTHGIIQTTSDLILIGQSGALNEHFADVFGSIINQYVHSNLSNPYLFGRNLLGTNYKGQLALRDMMNPEKSSTAQPSHMDQVTLEQGQFSMYNENCIPSNFNDNCGVHSLNGIPNKAAAIIMSKLGIDLTGKIYFHIMTKEMKTNSSFEDYAVSLRSECNQYGEEVCSVVDEALHTVGL